MVYMYAYSLPNFVLFYIEHVLNNTSFIYSYIFHIHTYMYECIWEMVFTIGKIKLILKVIGLYKKSLEIYIIKILFS